MNDRILRFHELSRLVGLGRSAINRRVSAGQFPKPSKLSVRAIGWRRSDVLQYIEARKSADLSEVPPALIAEIEHQQRLASALALLQHMQLVRWAWPADGERRWRPRLRELVGAGPCTYVARNERFVLYVGQSSVGWARIEQHRCHWLSRHPAMIPACFEVVKFATPAEALRLEARLIRELAPVLNRLYPEEMPDA